MESTVVQVKLAGVHHYLLFLGGGLDVVHFAVKLMLLSRYACGSCVDEFISHVVGEVGERLARLMKFSIIVDDISFVWSCHHGKKLPQTLSQCARGKVTEMVLHAHTVREIGRRTAPMSTSSSLIGRVRVRSSTSNYSFLSSRSKTQHTLCTCVLCQCMRMCVCGNRAVWIQSFIFVIAAVFVVPARAWTGTPYARPSSTCTLKSNAYCCSRAPLPPSSLLSTTDFPLNRRPPSMVCG